MPEINLGLNPDGVVRGVKRANRAFSTLSKRGLGLISKVFNPLNTAIAGIGGTAALVGITRITDDFEVMASQLEFVTGSAEDAEKVEKQLFEISKQTGTQLSDNADSYVKLTQAQKLTKLSSDDNIKVIGALNALMIKTGTKGAQASAAMLQLSQALTSGKLAGDEFRSLAENAPGLLNAMGEAMGIPREQLKAMSTAGELTSEKMGKAFLEIAESSEITFDSLPKTVAKGWNAIVLSFREAWDQINDDTGIMRKLSDALVKLSDWIEEKTPVFSQWIQDMLTAWEANWPTLQPQLQAFWENLKDIGKTIVDTLLGANDNFTKGVGNMFEPVNKIATALASMAGHLSSVATGFSNVWDSWAGTIAKTAINNMERVYNIWLKISTLPRAALAIIGKLVSGQGISVALDTGQDIVEDSFGNGSNRQQTTQQTTQTTNNFNLSMNKKDVEEVNTMSNRAGARI
jgi:tape measure domain-containing protein